MRSTVTVSLSGMRLALDVHKSQCLPPQNHNGVVTRRACAAELAVVCTLGREKRRRGYSAACSSSTPSKSSSPRSGGAGGSLTTPPALVRSACTWRSMFTKVRASPFSITTAGQGGRRLSYHTPRLGSQRMHLALDVHKSKGLPF